jgi:hypothetical protein
MNRREPHEDRAYVAGGRGFMCDLQRQSCLAHATGADERENPLGRIRDPLPQELEILFAADESRLRQRQPARGKRIGFDDGAARHPQQRVSDRRRQVECAGKRTQRLGVRTAALAPLERADGMHREPRDRRELVLGEPGGFTQRPEPGPQCPWWGVFLHFSGLAAAPLLDPLSSPAPSL